MTRAEFLAVLSVRLQDVPAEEREEAIKYYNEYLDEAGPEREADVIDELGGPEKVANIIRANCAGMSSIYSDPKPPKAKPELNLDETDYAAQLTREEAAAQAAENAQAEPDAHEAAAAAHTPGAGYAETQRQGAAYSAQGPYAPSGAVPPKAPAMDTRVWWIIGLAVTFPIWIGLLGGIFGGIAGLVGGLAGILFGGAGLIIAGITAIVGSIGLLGVATANGLVNLGIALLCIALGCLLLAGGVWCLAKGIPLVIRLVRRGIDFIRGKVGTR